MPTINTQIGDIHTMLPILSEQKFLMNRYTFEVISMVVVTLLIYGCASIPISTMGKMATYDVEKYLRLDPAVVRLRITSDSDDPLVIEQAKLTMQIIEKDGKETNLAGALVIESVQDLKPDKGFFSFGYQPEHIYVLKFNEEAIKLNNELQQLIIKHNKEKEKIEKLGIIDERKRYLTTGVDIDFRGKNKATLIIEVLYCEKDGYLTLLNKVKFAGGEGNIHVVTVLQI